MKISVARRKIKTTQQFTVKRHAVRVVIVIRCQDFPPSTFGGANDFEKLTIVKGLIANEVDFPNACRFAFFNLENQIDTVLLKLDDLGFNRRGKPAITAVKFKNTLHVGLNLGTRVNHTRTQLKLGTERIIFQTLITFKGNTVNDRVFNDINQKHALIE